MQDCQILDEYCNQKQCHASGANEWNQLTAKQNERINKRPEKSFIFISVTPTQKKHFNSTYVQILQNKDEHIKKNS